jgi:hypothetical protein
MHGRSSDLSPERHSLDQEFAEIIPYWEVAVMKFWTKITNFILHRELSHALSITKVGGRCPIE